MFDKFSSSSNQSCLVGLLRTLETELLGHMLKSYSLLFYTGFTTRTVVAKAVVLTGFQKMWSFCT